MSHEYQIFDKASVIFLVRGISGGELIRMEIVGKVRLDFFVKVHFPGGDRNPLFSPSNICRKIKRNILKDIE